MFNRLKKNLSNRDKDSPPAIPKNDHTEKPATFVEQSGFICPICMAGLPSPEALQIHFDHEHQPPDAPQNHDSAPKDHHEPEKMVSNAIKDASLTSLPAHGSLAHSDVIGENQVTNGFRREDNLVEKPVTETDATAGTSRIAQLEAEMSDLQVSLTDEKWYTTELKKEYDALKQQYSKTCNDLENLKQEIKIATATNEELARQKEELQQIAAEKSKLVTEIQASMDVLQMDKEAACQQSENQVVELEKAAIWVRDLESQLMQRPGADDVMVLKKELVSVQTLMDQMTQESEERSHKVLEERQELQRLLDEARERAIVVQQEFDQFKAENERLKVENQEKDVENVASKKTFQNEQDKLKMSYTENEAIRVEELANIQAALEKEASYSLLLEKETNKLKEEKLEMKEQLKRLNEEVKSLAEKSISSEKDFENLQSELNSMTQKNSELENMLTNAEEIKKTIVGENEKEVTELQARCDSSLFECEELKSQITEARHALDQSKMNSDELETQLTQLRSANQQLELESSAAQQDLGMQISQLKIKLETQETEYGQLNEERIKVEDQMKMLRSSSDEERTRIESKLLDAEKLVLELRLQNARVEEETSQKSRDSENVQQKLASAQSLCDELRDKVHCLETEVALKQQEAVLIKDQLSTSASQLEHEIERRENAIEEGKKLREERRDLLAKMEAGEGEAAARSHLQDENQLLRRQKEEAEEKVREEESAKETAIRNLTSQISESQSTIMTLQEKLSEHEFERSKMQQLFDEEQGDKLKIESELKEKTESLLTMQSKSISMQAELNAELNAVRRQLDLKSDQLIQAEESLKSSKTELEKLKSQFSNFRESQAIEITTLQGELKVSHLAIESATKKAEKWKDELKRMKETNDEQSERSKEEMKSSAMKFSEKISAMRAIIETTEQNLQTKVDELAELKTTNEKQQQNLTQLMEKSESLDRTHTATKCELTNVCLELEETRKKLSDSESSEQKSNEAVLLLEGQNAKLKEDSQKLEEQNSNLEQLLEAARESRTVMQQTIVTSQSRIGKLQTGNEEILKNWAEEKLKSEKECIMLQEEITEQKSTLIRLEENFANLNNELSAKNLQIKQQLSDNSDKNLQIEKLRTELDRTTTQLTETEVDLQNLKIEMETLSIERETLVTKSNEMDQSKSALEETVATSKVQISELEALLLDRNFEKETLQTKVATLEQDVKSIQEEKQSQIEELNSKNQDLKNIIVSHEEKLELLETQISVANVNWDKEKEENRRYIEEEEEKRARMEEKWNEERNKMAEEISTLETAQSLLISNKVALQGELKSLKQTMESDRESWKQNADMDKAVIQLKEENIDKLKHQLDEKNKMLETIEADRVVNESRLQLEIGALSENLNNTRSEWRATSASVDQLRGENDGLRGQIGMLQMTAQSNTDERRALLERCLNAEQQVEQHQININQLMRKLEGAQSAMHELGRENQALQVKHTSTISKKWTDDRTTTECRGCNRMFSLTVRKHHCRHCGEIFCGECSSRTATVAASKNPVRVCERCYDDLLVAG